MKQDEEIGKYMRAKEAARYLGLSLPTLRKMAREGKIDAFLTPSRKYRYDVSSFLVKAKAATKAYHARQLDLFEKKGKADVAIKQAKRSSSDGGTLKGTADIQP